MALLPSTGNEDEYVFVPVIPVDTIVHDATKPICKIDPTCPCHEDPDNIARIGQQWQDGLVTPQEATRILEGRNL